MQSWASTLGTEFLKAAIAKPGSPIDVVLTKDSKRKEAATLAFKPSRAQSSDEEAFPERLYGGGCSRPCLHGTPATSFRISRLCWAFRDTRTKSKNILPRYPGLIVVSIPRIEGNARGTVGFKSKNYGGKRCIHGSRNCSPWSSRTSKRTPKLLLERALSSPMPSLQSLHTTLQRRREPSSWRAELAGPSSAWSHQ